MQSLSGAAAQVGLAGERTSCYPYSYVYCRPGWPAGWAGQVGRVRKHGTRTLPTYLPTISCRYLYVDRVYEY